MPNRFGYWHDYYKLNKGRIHARRNKIYREMSRDPQWMKKKRANQKAHNHLNIRFMHFAKRHMIRMTEARELLLEMDQIFSIPLTPEIGTPSCESNPSASGEYISTTERPNGCSSIKSTTDGPTTGDGISTAPILDAMAASNTPADRAAMADDINPLYTCTSRSRRGREPDRPLTFIRKWATRAGMNSIAGART